MKDLLASVIMVRTAYSQGLRAKGLGLGLESCPYDSWLRTAWRKGWTAGGRVSVKPESIPTRAYAGRGW